MFTIAGATGRVGSTAARHLLEAGHPVRVLVRDPAKGADWSARGAEVAVADLGDRAALTDALAGSEGAFVLLPFDLSIQDVTAHTRRQVAAIAGAVADSGTPHVVALSSIGADLPGGTGPIVGLHDLEQALRATDAVLTAVRSVHFQEKVADILDVARSEGIYPVFGSADEAKPMVATRDIGAVVADALLARPGTSEVIDVEGPRYTEGEVADRLGAALGRELAVVTIPQDGWTDAYVDAGVPRHLAEVLAELDEAGERGLLVGRGDRTVTGTTTLETTLDALLGIGAVLAP